MFVGITVAVIAVALAIFFVSRSVLNKPGSPQGSNSAEVLPKPTREDVPEGTVVPESNSENLPSGVAEPQNVKQTAGENSPYSRSFRIVINNNSVSPNNIVAYADDILTVTFESADKDYDFVQPDLGLRWQVPAGGSKSFQFQASNPGKFIFYCPSCGGPEKGPVGYFTAVAK
jgi:heme/copper-type cytochrome/quinol oxidase subunit 2